MNHVHCIRKGKIFSLRSLNFQISGGQFRYTNVHIYGKRINAVNKKIVLETIPVYLES